MKALPFLLLVVSFHPSLLSFFFFFLIPEGISREFWSIMAKVGLSQGYTDFYCLPGAITISGQNKTLKKIWG